MMPLHEPSGHVTVIVRQDDGTEVVLASGEYRGYSWERDMLFGGYSDTGMQRYEPSPIDEVTVRIVADPTGGATDTAA